MMDTCKNHWEGLYEASFWCEINYNLIIRIPKKNSILQNVRVVLMFSGIKAEIESKSYKCFDFVFREHLDHPSYFNILINAFRFSELFYTASM